MQIRLIFIKKKIHIKTVLSEAIYPMKPNWIGLFWGGLLLKFDRKTLFLFKMTAITENGNFFDLLNVLF
jgi:hypothetical protein